MRKEKLLFCLLILIIVFTAYFLILYQLNNSQNIYCNIISSKGFISIANHSAKFTFSESTSIPKTYPTKDNEIIYIHNTAISNFVKNYLPNIRYRFILLSGDSDVEIPASNSSACNSILANKYLILWYSQNCTVVTEKLRQLPIGLDYHMRAYPYLNILKKNLGKTMNPIDQEKELLYIRKCSYTIYKNKLNKCYANFHLNLTNIDRKHAKQQLPSNLIFYEPKRIERKKSWMNMIKYKYVISPLGNGLDCHRTWESLVLGCIPIVKTSQLDPMYDGLPVLIVKNWYDVNATLLSTFIPSYKNIEKIKTFYWIDQFLTCSKIP
jgi:hypothetical protein